MSLLITISQNFGQNGDMQPVFVPTLFFLNSELRASQNLNPALDTRLQKQQPQ